MEIELKVLVVSYGTFYFQLFLVLVYGWPFDFVLSFVFFVIVIGCLVCFV